MEATSLLTKLKPFARYHCFCQQMSAQAHTLIAVVSAVLLLFLQWRVSFLLCIYHQEATLSLHVHNMFADCTVATYDLSTFWLQFGVQWPFTTATACSLFPSDPPFCNAFSACATPPALLPSLPCLCNVAVPSSSIKAGCTPSSI